MEGSDFGHDIIPALLGRYKVMAYPYRAKNILADYTLKTTKQGKRVSKMEKNRRDAGYWRDVANLDAYWTANMDLCGVEPLFTLYRPTLAHPHLPRQSPRQFVFADECAAPAPVGKAWTPWWGGSIVPPPCAHSVLASTHRCSPGPRRRSVIMDDCHHRPRQPDHEGEHRQAELHTGDTGPSPGPKADRQRSM